jgi:hypothetical protein
MIDPGATTYGRYLGVVYAEGQAKSINEQLVESGAAAHLPFGESGSDMYDRKDFAAAEKGAIESGQGMWQEPFFQTYLDVSKGLGGRLTFNTLTDLSRLSRNYKLAAAQQAMWTAQETGEDQNAYKIGKSLKSSYGRFFTKNKISSKDDDYNTIEGLRHGGMAAYSRPGVGFGSGAVFKTIVRMAENMMPSATTKAYASGLSATARRLYPEATEIITSYSGKAGMELINIRALRGEEVLHTASRAIEEGSINLVNIEIAKSMRGGGRFSRWAQAEHDILATHFPGQKMWSMTVSDVTKAKYEKLYGAVQEVPEGFPNLLEGRIPAKDDAYNTIEGLGHRGISSILRKKTTDFGSGLRTGLIASGGIVSKMLGVNLGGNIAVADLKSGLGIARGFLRSVRAQTTSRVPLFGQFSGLGGGGVFAEEFSTKTARSELAQLIKHTRAAERTGKREVVLINKDYKSNLLNQIDRMVSSARDALGRGEISKEIFESALPQIEKAKQEVSSGWSRVLRGIIGHEKLGHQQISIKGLRSKISELKDFVPDNWKAAEELQGYIKHQKGNILNEEFISVGLEEISRPGVLASTVRQLPEELRPTSEQLRKVSSTLEDLGLSRSIRSMASGKIWKKPSNGRLRGWSRKMEMAEAQRSTQVKSSLDGLYGGKGHTRYTNKGD